MSGRISRAFERGRRARDSKPNRIRGAVVALTLSLPFSPALPGTPATAAERFAKSNDDGAQVMQERRENPPPRNRAEARQRKNLKRGKGSSRSGKRATRRRGNRDRMAKASRTRNQRGRTGSARRTRLIAGGRRSTQGRARPGQARRPGQQRVAGAPRQNTSPRSTRQSRTAGHPRGRAGTPHRGTRSPSRGK